MRKRVKKWAVLGAVALGMLGCNQIAGIDSGTPRDGTGGSDGTSTTGTGGSGARLIGIWGTLVDSSSGILITLNLDANGTFSERLEHPSCNGSIELSGPAWTSNATEISFAGTLACTGGMIDCQTNGGDYVDCSSLEPSSLSGVCTYTLSADDELRLGTCDPSLGISTPATLWRGL